MILEENKQYLKISKPKMDFNKCKDHLCVNHQDCSFQTSKLKYFSENIAKKSNSFVFKNLEENSYNNSFFPSKTYSNISNSTVAYIVGGFVGSKSQMNNNEHNLLYDLSAVISNILNSSKYEMDKTSLKRSENFFTPTTESFQEQCGKVTVNESSQKKKKMKNLENDEVDFSHYIDVPLQRFIEKEKETCNYNQNHESLLINTDFKLQCCDTFEIGQVIDEVCNDQSSEDSLEDVCMEIAKAESLCEIQSKKNENDLDSSNLESQKMGSQCLSTIDINENKNNIMRSNSTISIPDSFNETDKSTIKKNVYYSIELEKPKSKIIPNHSNNYFASQRFRQQSECSVESTDSESFIVFEDPCFSEIITEKQNFTSDDDLESAIFSEEESDDENEVNKDSEFNSSIDNLDFCTQNSVEKNINFLQNNDKVGNDKLKVPKKVRFNENIKINKIIAWDHAYRTARVGPWEQMARDRCRFQGRIAALSIIISPILSIEHRTKIYNNLYL